MEILGWFKGYFWVTTEVGIGLPPLSVFLNGLRPLAAFSLIHWSSKDDANACDMSSGRDDWLWAEQWSVILKRVFSLSPPPLAKWWSVILKRVFSPSLPPLAKGASYSPLDRQHPRSSLKAQNQSTNLLRDFSWYSPPVDGEESWEPGPSSSVRVSPDGRNSIAGQSSSSIFFTRGQDWGGLGWVWWRQKSDVDSDLDDMMGVLEWVWGCVCVW